MQLRKSEPTKEEVWEALIAKNPGEWNPVKYLKTLRTRQLLDLLKSCRIHGFWDVLDNHSDHVVTLDQLKAELATREHIPNKKEAKALRQERARKK